MEYVTDNDWGDEAPLEELRPVRRHIIAAPALLAFFLLLYAIMFLLSRGWNVPLGDLLVGQFSERLLSLFGALTGEPLSEGRELWRLVTGAFVHVNLIHLFFNCYCVFSLGKAVESYYGTRRMFVSFLICSVMANIATVGLSPRAPFYIGTLGGLFGLDGVLLGFALRNRSSLPAKTFRWMLGGALFWPVFWVVLALTVFERGAGIAGLISGFGAGACLGLAFEAVRFTGRSRPSGAVTGVFVVALLACMLSWLTLAGAELARFTGSESWSSRNLDLDTHICREGGFEIPVPEGMSIAAADEKLDITRRGATFCQVTWSDAGPYDEPETLAQAVISELSLGGGRGGELGEVHLVDRGRLQVGGEEAVYFVLSIVRSGHKLLHNRAILIHDGKIYTISFYYPAESELWQDRVDAMLRGFRFTGP